MKKLLLFGYSHYKLKYDKEGVASKVNPAEKIAKHFHNTKIGKYSVISHVLPVDYNRVPEMIRKQIIKIKPDAVLLFGHSGRNSTITLERVAINYVDSDLPDEKGRSIKIGKRIYNTNQNAYFSTLPLLKIVNRLSRLGIPIKINIGAGGYLCNYGFFIIMNTLETLNLNVPAGLIHIPFLPEQVTREYINSPSVSFDLIKRGVAELIKVI